MEFLVFCFQAYTIVGAFCAVTFFGVMYIGGTQERDGYGVVLVTALVLGFTWPWTAMGLWKKACELKKKR